jgi:hypothetical protein
LGPIKQVEELGSELQAELIVRPEPGGFEEREVKVVDTFLAEPRINARLIAECKGSWLPKARSIKPLVEFVLRTPGYRLVRAQDVRQRTASK